MTEEKARDISPHEISGRVITGAVLGVILAGFVTWLTLYYQIGPSFKPGEQPQAPATPAQTAK